MIDFETWKKGWKLLDHKERRKAWIVLAVVVVAGLSSAIMIGSIMPFLSVLAEPDRIRTVPVLAKVYKIGGFQSDFEFLTALGIVSLFMIIIANLIQLLQVWVVSRFAWMQSHTLSYRLLSAYLSNPYEFFLNRHSAEMSTQVLSETERVVQQFFKPAAEIVASAFTVIMIVSLLLWVNPIVALAAFATLSGTYGVTFAMSKAVIGRLGKVRAKANSERYKIVSEVFGGVKQIKLLGRERSYVDRYEGPSKRMAKSFVVVNVLGQSPNYVMQTVAFGGMILLCLVLMDASGSSSGTGLGGLLPLLGVFAFAGQRLMPELNRLYQGLTRLQYGKETVDRVYIDFLAAGSDCLLQEKNISALGLNTELRISDVSYSYPNAEIGGLKNINIDIKAGEKIGIVGSTGAGKTTLADLILGLLRPQSGAVYADAIEITKDSLPAWKKSVSYVPQDIFLIDASVAENIAIGELESEIDKERILKASRIAQIDKFISNELPNGYATKIGERGVRLSGGQRQRIGIARALYLDADIIVFDEATSSLDNLTEREVMSAIEALPGEKTVLMIAHRLSTVERCDRIIVLEAGRVVGFDNWEGLMANNEAFRKIAR